MSEKYCNKCGQCHPDTSAECPPIEKPANVLSSLREYIARLEAELAEAQKHIAELEEDVRTNSHMLAELHDTTVPEEIHNEELARLQKALEEKS